MEIDFVEHDQLVFMDYQIKPAQLGHAFGSLHPSIPACAISVRNWPSLIMLIDDWWTGGELLRQINAQRFSPEYAVWHTWPTKNSVLIVEPKQCLNVPVCPRLQPAAVEVVDVH